MKVKKEYLYHNKFAKDESQIDTMISKDEAREIVSFYIGDTYLESFEEDGPLHFEYVPDDELALMYREEIAEHFPEENVDDMIQMAGGLVRILKKWEREYP